MNKLEKNSNHHDELSIQHMQSLVHEVLAMAKARGATQAEVGASFDTGFDVQVRLGEVDSVEFSRDKGIGITVYFDKQKGTASSSDTSMPALTRALDIACDIAKASAVDPCFGLVDEQLIQHDYPQLSLYHPWEVSPQQAIELAKDCEAKAMAVDKRISNSEGVSVSSYELFRAYANSHGFSGHYRATRHGMSCFLLAQESGKMESNYDYTTSRLASELAPLEELAQSAADKTIKRLNSRPIKTQSAKVLFSNDVSSTIASHFASAISGGNLYRKNTFLLDSLDKQIFPEFVSIYEQPHLLKALGSCPYDNDGLVTRENHFVDRGKVTSYILSAYTSRRLGMQTTADCGGVHNLTVDATGQSFAELLQEMNTGLLVTELMGQGVNMITGDYSRGASGFWVENGEIQYPVSEITIASNLGDMFKNIKAIGTDVNKRKPTRCGSILIDSMMIAGN